MQNQILPAELHRRLEEILGQSLGPIRTVKGNSSVFLRLIISLADNTSVFAKIATDSRTADWLRQEYKVYGALSDSFMARCLAWDDDGVQPVLVLEDLSKGYWPPPWTDMHIRQVVETLQKVSSASVPDLPLLEDNHFLSRGWLGVAEEPELFLSLGLATETWLEAVLPELLRVDGREVLRGQALLHLDVRSDNLCFAAGRVVLIDWNWVCRGSALFDLGAWLPSLEAEGGPAPETILPAGGEIAALLSGYFAAQAGLPPPPNAPGVRPLQLAQLRSALPWTVRALDLPPLDGPSSRVI